MTVRLEVAAALAVELVESLLTEHAERLVSDFASDLEHAARHLTPSPR